MAAVCQHSDNRSIFHPVERGPHSQLLRSGCHGALPNVGWPPVYQSLNQRNMPGRKLCQRGIVRMRRNNESPSLPPPLSLLDGVALRGLLRAGAASAAGVVSRAVELAPKQVS